MFVPCAQLCQLFVTPWTVACKAPLSMEFSRKEKTEVGCHVLLQGIFLTQGLNLSLLCLLHCWYILYHRAMGKAPRLLRARKDKSDVTYDQNYWKLLSSFDSHGFS